jgi:hypothetical protein
LVRHRHPVAQTTEGVNSHLTSACCCQGPERLSRRGISYGWIRGGFGRPPQQKRRSLGVFRQPDLLRDIFNKNQRA